MIPEFPEFKKLEVSDKETVSKFISKFPPYSDFNFVSMWSWDTKGEMKISQLNGNLVVRFTDYISGDPFYSFLGNNKTNETTEELLSLSKKEGLKPALKLVPGICVQRMNREKFDMREDVDNMDYIISIDRLKPHDGTERRLSSRRKMINKLKLLSKCSVVPIDLNNSETKEKILSVFLDWEIQRGVDTQDIKHLKGALERMLNLKDQHDTLALGLFVDDKFVGYSINEIIGGGYALGNFQQADLKLSQATYSLLMQETSLYLEKLGCKFINLEQDLGIEGLRRWKKSYNPIAFLKKYVVVPVQPV